MLTFLEPKNSDTSCCSPRKGEEQSALAGSNSFMERKPCIGEIVFPSLENLELSAMEDIEELVGEEHAATAFPKLKALMINTLCKLKSIPETILNKLEQLKVHSCDSLHGLFEVKSTTLRNLELVNVRCLEHIQWTSLPNLYSLVIHGGRIGMNYIVTSADIAQGNVLHKLEFINIEQCEHLEEIVSKECDHELEFLKNGTYMFPRLKHVKLHSLPNIATFSSGRYEAIFPGLEKVEISGCPSLESFTSGTLATPKMKYLQVDQATVLEQIDLNHFLGYQKQGYSQTEKGSEQREVLQRSRAKLNHEQRKSITEATREILPGVWLFENSHIDSNGELVTNSANSKQSNCTISV